MLKLKVLIIFFSVYCIFDFTFTYFSKKKINFYQVYYPELSHRVVNDYYHHSFAPNVNTYDIWGSFKYKFITNSLGFKDSTNRVINLQNSLTKRILINGDSFTEGIGFKYEDTFVGLLDKHLTKKNIEVLNAGVASQSPIIYLSKIKYLLEEENLKFDELIIFLDISDIPDETYYKQKNNKLIIDEKEKIILEKIGIFLSKNFSSVLFYNVLIEKLDKIKRNIERRLLVSKEFNIPFFNITNDEIKLYKAIKVKRGNWTHVDKYWKIHGQKGRELAVSNLNKLLELCNNNNIKFSLVIYPWPSQIYYDIKAIKHRLFWKEWSMKNKVDFYDLFFHFSDKNKIELIHNYFVPGDIHWNKLGHKYIADIILKTYFKE